MTKTLQERLNLLQAAGINTDKYVCQLQDITLKSDDSDDVIKQIVGDKQINNKKLFRRWITAQTFKMLNYDGGWDAYLRNNYDYMYQFRMMLDEFKTLNKLELTDKEEFRERSMFFNKNVAINTCEHYMKQLHKYIEENKNDKGFIKLAKYGTICVKDIPNRFENKLYSIIKDMYVAEGYAELYSLLKNFMKHMNKIPQDTVKCSLWKDAFKGNGAYYTLKNLIMFHGVLLRDCKDKNTSLDFLTTYAKKLTNGDLWKLHMLLKDTIEFNNFDLRKSIESNK